VHESRDTEIGFDFVCQQICDSEKVLLGQDIIIYYLKEVGYLLSSIVRGLAHVIGLFPLDLYSFFLYRTQLRSVKEKLPKLSPVTYTPIIQMLSSS